MKSPQSKGGAARAAALTRTQRSEIARKGALAKKALAASPDLPSATHAGERKVDGYIIPVHNLSDGRRVLSERAFLAAIGAKGRGSSSGHRLARIVADPVIKSFFSQKLLVDIGKPVAFLSLTKVLTYGYEDEVLHEFCISMLKAKGMRALATEAQIRYGEYCESLVFAFSRVGIAAWIDEATGFQRDRARDALHQILDKYIADHWAKWSKTFPDEFYENIYRLKGHKYDPDSAARPGFIGRLTTDIVYARLAPGVIEELQRKNPVLDETRRRQRKHHQWLTRDFGHPKLKEHIANVTFMMKGAQKWESFYRNLQRAAPRLHETTPFDFGED